MMCVAVICVAVVALVGALVVATDCLMCIVAVVAQCTLTFSIRFLTLQCLEIGMTTEHQSGDPGETGIGDPGETGILAIPKIGPTRMTP